jgi:hypothetical protein
VPEPGIVSLFVIALLTLGYGRLRRVKNQVLGRR